MRLIFLGIVLASMLWSCGEPTSEHAYINWYTDFPDDTWNASKIVEFDIMIKDNTKKYDLSIGVRHSPSFPLNTLRMRMQLISPSGFKANRLKEIPIMDREGKFTADCKGKVCEKIHLMDAPFGFYEPGNYRFRLHLKMDLEELKGIQGITMVLDDHLESVPVE